MTPKRISIALLIAFLSVAACNTPSDPPPTDEAQGEEDATGGNKKDKKVNGKGEGGDGDKRGDDKKGSDPSSGGDSEADGSEGSGGSDDLTEGSGEDDNSSAAYPAPGNYSYRQKGYEEFCQAANCERERLPARQPVTIATDNETPDAATVVMEMRSGNRMVRSTMRFDREVALVTKVYVRFAYSGFTFEETYTPKPPVQSLRFPLTAGESWSGSWKDSTSGDYRVEVFGQETVEVGGRSVRAFRYETFTDFRGQFNGRSNVETWIDPATKAIVKTQGVLNVTSAFGRYSTKFATQLESGPAYR